MGEIILISLLIISLAALFPLILWLAWEMGHAARSDRKNGRG